MALNYVWIFFFVVSFVIGLAKLIFLGDMNIFPEMMTSAFDMAKTGFEISLGLTGVLNAVDGYNENRGEGWNCKDFLQNGRPFL